MTPRPELPDESTRRLLDSLTTGVVCLDDLLRVSYMNVAAETVLGVSVRQIRSQPIEDWLPRDPELARLMRRAANNGESFTEWEYRFNLPDGREQTVDLTVTPTREHGQYGLIMELIAVQHHVRVTREEQLLEQQLVSREVVRGLAHEIKNPLGGLRGAAQLLETELQDPALTEYTQIIVEEADRLRTLVDRMLGPNRVPDKQTLNIHQVLEHVHQLVAVENHGAITFVRDYDPSLPDILGDREQLIQAVLNIVRNAVQALDGKGNITLRSRAASQVGVGNRRLRLAARVDVIDEGPGIPDAMMEKIFYPMVTGRSDGNGLGLPIAQTLVNQHGGSVSCSSRPGQTVFSIILPLESEHE